MRILATGITGYMGGHIGGALQAAGHDVTALVRSEEARATAEKTGYAATIAPIAELATLVADYDAVLFAPQLAHDEEALVIGALLDAMRGTGKTLLFTSGTGVFAQETGGEWSEDSFGEEDAFDVSPFAAPRVGTENRIMAAADDVRGIIIRPPLVWGHGGSRHVPLIFDSIARTGKACYIGSGLNLYSNVHVDDVAALYVLALERGTAGAIYHAVSGEENFRTLAEAAAGVMGVSTRSVTLDEAIAIWGERPARFMFNMCSRSRAPRARGELQWVPRHRDLVADIREGSYFRRYAPSGA